MKIARKALNTILMMMLLSSSVVACANAREKEHYTAMYTKNGGCNWTQITCFSGDKRPENVIYQDNVCRYYFNYGELSVAHSYDEMIRNVVLTRSENCVFQPMGTVQGGYATM
jgi:hypothetical protein